MTDLTNLTPGRLGTWKRSRAEVSYHGEKQLNSDLNKLCSVVITQTAICVSYRWAMGRVDYIGTNNGSGCFTLLASRREISGTAHLHFIDNNTLAGDFVEQNNELTGDWVIHLIE
jgi:hypothetical protein